MSICCPSDFRVPTNIGGFYNDRNCFIIDCQTLYYSGNQELQLNFNLRYLTIGQRVGLCVTQIGELHCYIDGIDKGTLCTGLPTDVSYWGIVDVYGKTTKVQLVSPKETIQLVKKASIEQPSEPAQTLKEMLAQTENEKNELEKQLKVKMQQLQTEKRKQQFEVQEMIRANEELQSKLQDTQTRKQKLVIEKLQLKNQKLLAENQIILGKVAQLSIEIKRLNDQIKEQKFATTHESHWKVNYKEVTLTKQELGRGGWGVIWIGEFRSQKVAVKQMHELIVSSEFLQLLNREINIMAQLRHPNLLQFIGAILDHPSGNPMIITEIMDISLRGAYEKKQLSPVPVSICLSIMRDVAVGLNYLHCLPDPIIHRDVSSANVLLESKGPEKWKTKLSNFRFSELAVTTAAFAEIYGAPESFQSIAVFNKKKQTIKMDTFSYGILFCEIIMCQFPHEEIFHHLLKQIEIWSPLMHQLILQCISEDPQDRPTMKQVIQQLDSIF